MLRTLVDYFKWDIQHVPLLRCAVPFAVGIALSGVTTTDVYIPAVLSLSLSLAFFIIGLNKSVRLLGIFHDVLLVCSMLLMGMSYGQIRRNSSPIGDYGDRCYLTGYVHDVYRDTGDELKVVVVADTMTTCHHRFYDVRGLLTFDSDSLRFIPGERIEAWARIRRQHAVLFSTFDYSSFLHEKDLQYEAEVNVINKMGDEGLSFATILGRIRNGVYDRLLMSGVDSTNVDFLMALVVGDKSRLPKSLKDEFSDCGLVHLIAVSGLHVGIIYCLLLTLVGEYKDKRKWYVSLAIIVVLWLYSAICGFSPSSLRAVVMMSVIELSSLAKRQSDMGSTLCVAAFIVLLIDPVNIYSLGFWLSFSAVAGIMSFYSVLNRFDPFRSKSFLSKYVYSALCVSVVAQIATQPISLLYFHRFPTYFLINNIVVIGFIYPIVGWSMLSILMAHVVGLGCVLNYVVYALRWYVSFASSLPYSSITDIPFTLPDCSLAILALYTLAWIFRRGVFVMNNKGMHQLFILFLSMFLVSWSYTIFSVSKRNSISLYETWKSVGMSYLEDRHAMHWVSDTTYASSLSTIRRFDKYVYAKSSETSMLKPGMTIVGNKFVVCVAASTDTVDCVDRCDILLVADDVKPYATTGGCVAISSMAQYRDEWIDYCDMNNITYYDLSKTPMSVEL